MVAKKGKNRTEKKRKQSTKHSCKLFHCKTEILFDTNIKKKKKMHVVNMNENFQRKRFFFQRKEDKSKLTKYATTLVCFLFVFFCRRSNQFAKQTKTRNKKKYQRNWGEGK